MQVSIQKTLKQSNCQLESHRYKSIELFAILVNYSQQALLMNILFNNIFPNPLLKRFKIVKN